MSRINGDKARFNRLRKKAVARRTRIKTLGAEPVAKSTTPKPKAE